MNYVEIKIDGEICRVSWEPNDAFLEGLCDIEKIQMKYVGDIIKQALLGVGYSPETVNEYFQPDEDEEEEAKEFLKYIKNKYEDVGDE